MNISITRRQKAFIDATETEVLFGGAAGGGKSYGQLVDAFLYAMKYPKSKQLLLRRTFPELEHSLIRTARELYPIDRFTYNASSHTGKFFNGSILDFGHLATDGDVYQYQSAEYDVIRFDELTHFTEFQYTYLMSRIRAGGNNYPKHLKSSTNPGGVGHTWVKERFIDPAPPNTSFIGSDGISRIFLPAKIDDNKFLMANDPTYKDRLRALGEDQQKALLLGEWDIYDGQYFTEFSRDRHVCQPFPIPEGWRKYRALDYGLDRLACLWIAVDPDRRCYVYREKCESNLIISDAAKAICELTDEEIYATFAPVDLWSRSQETGKCRADMFHDNGVRFTQASNNRIDGWLALRELLKDAPDGVPYLQIFSTCTELIRCIPALVYDEKKIGDAATEPHEVTHAPDALRYFSVAHTKPAPPPEKKRVRYTADMLEDYYRASPEERAYLERKYGGKPIS